MSKNAQKNKRKPRNLMFRICIFAFVIYASVLLIDMQINMVHRRRQLSELEQRVETQRIANKELERQLGQGMDQDYFNRIAREILWYIYPDETVYIDISGS